MNSIPTEQNSERQLQRLAAQRQLYSTAKTIFGWHVLASGPLAIASALFVAGYPQFKAYAALWGLLVSLCDVMWLSPWQKRLRSAAATVQEAFDCDVLVLPWNQLKAGHRPDPELVAEQAHQYARVAASMPPLRDWYCPRVGCLPLHVARLACQRANCWWDSKQRQRYAVGVITAVTVVFVLVTVLSMVNGFTVEDFIIKVVAPLLPVLLLGYRQFTEQLEAATRLTKLKEHAEGLWADALRGEAESAVSMRSRQLQDEILDSRKGSPLVFDAIFRIVRSRLEMQMTHGAEAFVAEAKQRLGL